MHQIEISAAVKQIRMILFSLAISCIGALLRISNTISSPRPRWLVRRFPPEDRIWFVVRFEFCGRHPAHV
jgi:hypothetical protein